MNRETVVQNITINYGNYGFTAEIINELIDIGLDQGMSYDLIYLELKRQICEIIGEEYYCTASDLAKALGISNEEMYKLIEKSREELIAAGENPDEYFVDIETSRYMM